MDARGYRKAGKQPAGAVRTRVGEQTGASFLIALFFALVVALIATLVISSASVNAERTAASNRADEQAYFAVVSALDSGGALVERDICAGALSVSVDSDKNVDATISTADKLGLAAWARDQVQTLVHGGTAQPKNVVVHASDMGEADVPDVLLTYTMTDSGVYLRACVDVWGSAAVPTTDDDLKADLVEDAAYAEFLTKQVASSPKISGSAPMTVTWTYAGGA